MRLKTLAAGAALTVVLGACAPGGSGSSEPSAQPDTPAPAQAEPAQPDAATATRPDPRNATYDLGGESVALVDGLAEGEPVAPGSAMRERTTVLGSPVYGDLDGDGREDAAVLLANDPGGSGTFVYLAAVIPGPKGQQGTNAVLLGDRIGTPELSIDNGVVRAKFLDRSEDAALADAPTVPRVVEAKLQSGQLVEQGAQE
ncbi:MAG TPA: hypothetical protein VGD21_01640 [Lysobacter sp.]